MFDWRKTLQISRVNKEVADSCGSLLNTVSVHLAARYGIHVQVKTWTFIP